MFSLFQKQEDQSSDRRIFDESDIRQVLQSFSSTGHPKLFLSTSGTSLVQTDGIRKSLESWSSQAQGRKPVSEFATLTTVDSKTILNILSDINGVVTVDQKLVISNDEQKAVVERLISSAREAFVDEVDFCSKENLNPVSLATIVARYKRQNDLVTVQRPSDTQPSDTKSFIISKKLQEDIHMDLVQQVTSAEEKSLSNGPQSDGSGAILKSTTFPGLPIADALFFCGAFKARTNAIKGEFRTEAGSIFYVPKSYVSALRTRLFLDLKAGGIPFLDVSRFVDELPGEFESKKAVLEALEEFMNSRDSFHVLEDYALSSAWIEAQGVKVQEALDKNEPVSQQQYCGIIPKYQDEVWDLIIDSLKSFEPYNTMGNHIVSKQWIESIETKTEAFAKELANHAWLAEESFKSKPTAITAKVKGELQAALIKEGVDEDLVDIYLDSGRKELDSVILGTYNTVINQFELACDDQFKRLWASRVVDSSRLYATALQTMEESPFKSQLEALLLSHIASEAVPSTVNKAKTRKLLRSPQLKLSTRLPKLQTTLSAQKDLWSSLQELEKFNEKLGIETYDGNIMHQKRTEHLMNLTESMSKDQDSVRLFICLLILLHSSTSAGVLYATGKFAPRLLKSMKPTLGAEQAQWLEQVKDAVKAGSVTEDMKNTMRDMASKVVKDEP